MDGTDNSEDFNWIDHIKECPTYYPTMEEFNDLTVYLTNIACDASYVSTVLSYILLVENSGICKTVSPLKAFVSADDVLKDKEFEVFI